MKKIIIANWKCNPITKKDAGELFKKVIKGTNNAKNTIVICPPFLYLSEMVTLIDKEDNIELGAQDCFWAENGPFTGEVSPAILKDLNIKYVIIGHSERRIHFNETDEMINKKLKAAVKTGLIPILCIGEKKGENAEEIIENQLKLDLAGISEGDLKKIIIAYEPVWAIGTGDFCAAEKAGRVCQFIRDIQNSKFKIQNSTVLYGGSVSSEIAKNYIDAGFDGLLVGGASLKANEFIKISNV